MAMRRWRRLVAAVAAASALVAVLGHLRDPPWLLAVTSGFGTWHEDEAGRRYRWTTRSHASFYVPASAEVVVLPLRPGIARPEGGPVGVSLAFDGRVFMTVTLDDPLRWLPVTFALPPGSPKRQAVRIEVIVRRLLRRENLGVQVGEPVIRHRAPGTTPVTAAGQDRGGPKEADMPMMPASAPRRRRLQPRHLCAACRERKARFQHAGEVRADHHHVLCFQCFRAARERLRAWQFRETYAPAHRYLRPDAIEHRRRMLAHLESTANVST